MASIINEIEENVEKGEKAVEELVERAEETVKKVAEKAEDIVKKIIKKKTGRKKIEKKDAETKKSSVKKSDKSDSVQMDEELEKTAEAESHEETEEARELAEKKKKLLEKAKKLKEKISGGVLSTEELKEKVKIKKRTDMLIPLEDYVKTGIYLGTKVVTPEIRKFVYRRRADGLAIFNTDLIDEKLKEGIEFLSKFAPEDIVVVCKREAGWKAVEKFSEVTGIRVFTKKYPAGILTNTKLPDFFEDELTIVCDSWLDKNALHDTIRAGKKVMMICDTNNFPKGANQIIIGNNKSPKSLGVMFYLLARGYCKARGMEKDIPELEWWTGEIGNVEDDAKLKARRGAEYGV